VSSVLGSLLLGYRLNLEKAEGLEEKGLLVPAAYYLYVALQLRASSLLYLVSPGSSHNCSVSVILRLIEKGLRERGLTGLAERVRKLIEEYRDAIVWAEKVHALAMYRPVEIDKDKMMRVKEFIGKLDELEKLITGH